MANSFGTDILIQAQDPAKAAAFYVEELGFSITDPNPNMIEVAGPEHQPVHRAGSRSGARIGSDRRRRGGG